MNKQRAEIKAKALIKSLDSGELDLRDISKEVLYVLLKDMVK